MLPIIRKILAVCLFCMTLYVIWSCIHFIIWREEALSLSKLLTPMVVLLVAYLGVRRYDEGAL